MSVCIVGQGLSLRGCRGHSLTDEPNAGLSTFDLGQLSHEVFFACPAVSCLWVFVLELALQQKLMKGTSLLWKYLKTHDLGTIRISGAKSLDSSNIISQCVNLVCL